MLSRRQFLGVFGVPAASATIGLDPLALTRALAAFPDIHSSLSPAEAARDESVWRDVQQAFTADRSLINLNNGGVGQSPRIVQESMKRHLDYSNTAPPYTMWRVLEPQREPIRERMARIFGCDTEEIALTRNASESLQICQLGIDLEPGDEILCNTQDYPRMLQTFRQRQRREGVKLVEVKIPIPAENDDEILRIYNQAITEKTRLILFSHIINITGQILPVKKVVQMARRKGIPVIVDGAHSFAHFDFRHEDLDCDYYGTSLHKWLFAPHGTGMLYVRRDRIKDLWAMTPAPETLDDDIRKFEEIGTHPAANYLAIAEALTFHEGIGPKYKEERLRYLRDYWARPLLRHDRVRLHTSLKPQYSCCIANIEIDGIDPLKLNQFLWKNHRIITVAIKHPEFQGTRVTPSLYTTIEELDRFLDVMEKVIRNGLPSAG